MQSEYADTIDKQIPSADDVRAFLRHHYKPERFEDRDNPDWDYSSALVRSHRRDLATRGESGISRFEHKSGEYFTYTIDDVRAFNRA